MITQIEVYTASLGRDTYRADEEHELSFEFKDNGQFVVQGVGELTVYAAGQWRRVDVGPAVDE